MYVHSVIHVLKALYSNGHAKDIIIIIINIIVGKKPLLRTLSIIII